MAWKKTNRKFYVRKKCKENTAAMSRKLSKIKFIFVAILALLAIILIYFLFYQSINDNYDEFIVVKAVEPYDDDDEISLSNLINFTHFQYKIKPDALCNNFEDELLGKTLHNN